MRWGRQRSGSVVCPSCGKLVGVNDERCYQCGRPNPGMWGFAPLLRRFGADFDFDSVVIGAVVVLFGLTLIATPGGPRSAGISFLSPGAETLVRFGASGPWPVFQAGRWWTPLSAGWLHGGLLHILFNVLWVRQLMPATTALYGAPRTVVIYVGSSVVGFVASAVGGSFLGLFRILLGGSPGSISVGASAAIFGLLGAMVYAGRRGIGGSLGSQAWTWAILLFVLGLLFPAVDNWAHLGGFAGGYALGGWLDPMRPERLDHTMAALGCLAASLAALLASLLIPF